MKKVRKVHTDVVFYSAIAGAIFFGLFGWLLASLLLAVIIFASIITIEDKLKEKALIIATRAGGWILGMIIMYGILFLRVKYNF